jgi:predicted nucleic-acid-binding protein
VLAVDTNIFVRYLTRDDAEQFAKASALIRTEDLYVCTTVLLETEWVLRRAYRFSRERVIATLVAFAGLPRVTLEDPAAAANALERARNGMDFADALHLAKAQHCEVFLSFDRRFAAVANTLGEAKVRAPRHSFAHRSGQVVGH